MEMCALVWAHTGPPLLQSEKAWPSLTDTSPWGPGGQWHLHQAAGAGSQLRAHTVSLGLLVCAMAADLVDGKGRSSSFSPCLQQ